MVIYRPELQKEHAMNNPKSIGEMRLTSDQDELVARVADSLKKGDQSTAVDVWRQLIKSLGGVSESDVNVLIQQTIQRSGLGAGATKVPSSETLGTRLKSVEEKPNTIGDDAQLANIDLQNMLQKQQQISQTLSAISKLLHDTAMAVIRNLK
jgi:hypothetical protein